MSTYRPSHNCGTLNKEAIEQTVILSGWVHRRRDHGGLIFIDLRDRYGLTQLVFDPQVNSNAHEQADTLRSEWVISVTGKVIARAEGMANPKLPTGEIEIEVSALNVLSRAKTPPFSVCDEYIEVNEELRLKYRYLDIRRGDIAKNLVMRHKAMMSTRQFLSKAGYLEISTPILGKSTPEGARDYLVPSRVHPGTFYALPQSPQIFKQLLMVSGLDRYFQIAQCFRDEDLRADRQPEFTQIDIEMSFNTPEDFFPIMEEMFQTIFKECLDVEVKAPFQQIPYPECMEKYGTDKPDLRFGMELVRVDEIVQESSFSIFLEQLDAGNCVKGLCVKGGADISRKGIDQYTTFMSQLGIKGLAWIKYQEQGLSSSIVKFFSEEQQKRLIEAFKMEAGDLIFMIADTEVRTNQALDHLRRKLARDRQLIQEGDYQFLWVTDFPLFSWNADEQRLESEHHPFTSPNLEDMHLMDSEPLKVRSSSYDLVLNGYELGSGSQRIHDTDLQAKIFSLLQLSDEEMSERFGFFIDALKYGTPPHLGIGLGFDRLIMILVGTENIRDVIAFPKTQRASDVMMDAPSSVDEQQLDDLKLMIHKNIEFV